MADKPIAAPLPADLPENWQAGQIVAPTGEEVNLSHQHGYNYLMEMVNKAQRGVNAVNDAFESVSGKRTCRYVVGTSTAGWTEADCDFLCDGTNDDVWIRFALSSMKDTGGVLVLLDGVYHISGYITIPEGCILRGCGNKTVLLRKTNAGYNGYFNVNSMIFMDVSKDNSKNLIIGNIFDSTDSIKLGAYTEGWFIMGNQLSTVTDQGTNNIIRFNSNDTSSGGGTVAGVTRFNGRQGAVLPQSGDYTAAMVGAIPASQVQAVQALTQAEYDALGTKSASTLYLIKE